jgi:acyl transferase domain-containing protein
VSLAKVIIALETKIIPKTLHYSVQNSRISELCNGKLEVVQENQHFKGDYIGINNFGFGGTNAHVLLKTYCVATPCTLENSRAKLVLYSSREPSSVEEAIEKIAKYDQFFHVLLRNANLMAGMAKVKAYSTANETSWKTMVS